MRGFVISVCAAEDNSLLKGSFWDRNVSSASRPFSNTITSDTLVCLVQILLGKGSSSITGCDSSAVSFLRDSSCYMHRSGARYLSSIDFFPHPTAFYIFPYSFRGL